MRRSYCRYCSFISQRTNFVPKETNKKMKGAQVMKCWNSRAGGREREIEQQQNLLLFLPFELLLLAYNSHTMIFVLYFLLSCLMNEEELKKNSRKRSPEIKEKHEEKRRKKYDSQSIKKTRKIRNTLKTKHKEQKMFHKVSL